MLQGCIVDPFWYFIHLYIFYSSYTCCLRFMHFVFSNLVPFVHKKMPLWLPIILVRLSNDVHLNPGPHFQNSFLNLMSWNVNSLVKDNFNCVRHIEAHNSTFNFDLISICEASLNFSRITCNSS